MTTELLLIISNLILILIFQIYILTFHSEYFNMSKNDDKCELSLESLCRTKDGEEIQFNFVWTIKNFSARPEKAGESLNSSTFNIQAPDDIKSDWKVELYPKGCFVY